MTVAYTPRQGQFLAFIYYYTKVNGRPPAERDIERYFKTSPSAVHQMILTLEKRGFIERTPGQGRSTRVLLPREALPDLEQGGGG
ncbi:MAG TPA: MarR family transcriptional regulator [Phycisphaerae bacterium]|nr:MarR family transcriptional regulator [Phycisphaerae bacterium]